MKRFLSLLLVATMLFAIVPVNANALYQWIDDRNSVDGSDYTQSESLAKALNEIFDGNASVYSDLYCNNLVNTRLGTSNVKDDGITLYVGAKGQYAINMGTSCWIYANGVYYTLFGECTGNGSAGPNSENLNIYSTSSTRATYANFQAWGVRKGVGALIRADGHSMIVLGYDSNTLTILDGNGDTNGLVSIRVRSWDQVGFYVSYIIQPKESYYNSLYPSCSHKNYTDDGICEDCGYVFDWEATLKTEDAGIYTVNNSFYPRTEMPYDSSAKETYKVTSSTVTVLGSLTNAHGNKWYKIKYDGKIGYVYESYLTFKSKLPAQITGYISSPSEGQVVPKANFPVIGTITSERYALHSIHAYLDDTYYANWVASDSSTMSVELRYTDVNWNLNFPGLSDGKHTLAIYARDVVNSDYVFVCEVDFYSGESADEPEHADTPSIYWWISDSIYGGEDYNFALRKTHYVCYNLYDNLTGNDWDDVSTNNYSVDMIIYNPDGSVNNSWTATVDTEWIDFTPRTYGTYRIEVIIDGDFSYSSSYEFTLEASVPDNLFWVTHYNESNVEGGGVVFTQSYLNYPWGIHVAFEYNGVDSDGSDIFKITEISNGLSDGSATPLSIPDNGFVWVAHVGNDYPSLGLGDVDYTSPSSFAMADIASTWSVGQKMKFNNFNYYDYEIPTSTPGYMWYEDAYVCTSTFEIVNNYASPDLDYWVSNSIYGNTIFDCVLNKRYYLCYNIFDTNSGLLWDDVADSDYLVELSVVDPYGDTIAYYSDCVDREWINFTPTVPGDYIAIVSVRVI